MFMVLILDTTVKSWLGSVDRNLIITIVEQASTSRGKYKVYIDEGRYKIGK